jgi:glycosyltransferase involved in cell wall biosynthesis
VNRPLITVLIDTYNYGRFIEEAIDSVLAQDFPLEQVEILVVDDGSTDDTSQRIRKYGSKIVYLVKPNGGQASAFNFGIRRATGEIVMFLDADDYWFKGKLHRIWEEFQKNPTAGMIHHRLTEVNSGTGESRAGSFIAISGFLGRDRKALLAFNPTPTTSLSFRKTCLDKIIPIPESVTIQADGYLQVIAPFLAPIVAVDECLAAYRIHNSNLYFQTNSQTDAATRSRRVVTLRAILNGVYEWFPSHGYSLSDPAVRAYVGRWRTMLEREQFTIQSPGRVRFFLHLLRTNANQLPLMSWKLILINYYMAFGALITGYEHVGLLDGLGQNISNKFRQLLGRNSEG